MPPVILILSQISQITDTISVRSIPILSLYPCLDFSRSLFPVGFLPIKIFKALAKKKRVVIVFFNTYHTYFGEMSLMHASSNISQ